MLSFTPTRSSFLEISMATRLFTDYAIKLGQAERLFKAGKLDYSTLLWFKLMYELSKQLMLKEQGQ